MSRGRGRAYARQFAGWSGAEGRRSRGSRKSVLCSVDGTVCVGLVALTQLTLLRTTEVPTERTAAIHTEKVVFYGLYCAPRPRTTQLSQCNSSAFKSYERSRTLCTSPPSASTQAHTVHHGEHAAMLHGAPSHASPAHHACSRSRCGRHASAIARGPAVHHRGAREHGLWVRVRVRVRVRCVLFPTVGEAYPWRSA